VRIGRLAIIAGNEAVSHDVPPFAAFRYGGLKGYNAIGCRRAGIPQSAIHAIRASYHCLHTRRTAPAALDAMRALACGYPEVRELHDFIASARRGIPPSVRFLGRIRHADGEYD
jgi:acyl-[acyl carrier protein]--UDP-N-acetylglucosamine O-acyltransferase